jgi:endonuclease YncB( thermonuclease family)
VILAAVTLVSMLAVAAVAAEPATLTGKVVSVNDGDTLRVLDAAGTQHKVRLQGIDSPETRQAFGTKARNRLAALAKGKTVTIHSRGQDRYGRVLASVDIKGDDLGHRLVADGLAWHYARYSKDAGLAAAERDARAAHRGLWADKAPVPPWEWRASEKGRRRVPAPAGR